MEPGSSGQRDRRSVHDRKDARRSMSFSHRARSGAQVYRCIAYFYENVHVCTCASFRAREETNSNGGEMQIEREGKGDARHR